MKVALLTNIVSPHQLPLAEEIVKLVGEDNYRYAYTEAFHEERARMGWNSGSVPKWCRPAIECSDFLENADLVYSELRDFELFEKRLAEGKDTFYVSERWLKPIMLPFGLSLPGWVKLLHPGYMKKVRRISSLFGFHGFRYLPQGPWAARDMRFICKVVGKPLDGSQMTPWGYFVAPSKYALHNEIGVERNVMRVLWVGRLIKLKRVDTIVRAIGEYLKRRLADNSLREITLDIYGTGPEETRLREISDKYGKTVRFYPSVPIAEVRRLMHEHEVYVFSSNKYEGWGAVVSEALEEHMTVIGTCEAGASAAMLPSSHLFHSGDWRRLAMLLTQASRHELKPTEIGMWTAKAAAKRMLELVE